VVGRRLFLLLLRDRPAGQLIYLQGADHTADIGWQYPGRGGWIDLRQARMQRRRAMLRSLALQRGA
jgi:hypothetical protein